MLYSRPGGREEEEEGEEEEGGEEEEEGGGRGVPARCCLSYYLPPVDFIEGLGISICVSWERGRESLRARGVASPAVCFPGQKWLHCHGRRNPSFTYRTYIGRYMY